MPQKRHIKNIIADSKKRYNANLCTAHIEGVKCPVVKDRSVLTYRGNGDKIYKLGTL